MKTALNIDMLSALSTNRLRFCSTRLTLYFCWPRVGRWHTSARVSPESILIISLLGLFLTEAAGNDSVKVLDYFAKNGAPCPPEANPAEHIVDVIQGKANEKVDWVEAWNQSEERQHAMTELEALNNASKADPDYEEDQTDFATPMWFQFRMVWERLMTQLWRSPVGKPAEMEKKKVLTAVGLYVE